MHVWIASMIYGNFKRLRSIELQNCRLSYISWYCFLYVPFHPCSPVTQLLFLACQIPTCPQELSLSQEPISFLSSYPVWVVWPSSVFPEAPHPHLRHRFFCFFTAFSSHKQMLNACNDLDYSILKLPVYTSLPHCFISILHTEIRSDLFSNPQVPNQF